MLNKQRSNGWHEQRKARITASRLGDVLAGIKTKRFNGYIQDIVLSMLGAPTFQDDKPWFQHGVDWEPEAIALYEWETGNTVAESGFIVHPDYDFIGCSPDGIITGGGVEAKSRKSLTGHLKSEKAGIDTVYMPQVQGSMWITGSLFWDFISYYKNNNGKTLLHIHRVNRDDKYIKNLEERCLMFWAMVQNELKQRRRNDK